VRCSLAGAAGNDTVCPLRDLFILAIRLLVTLVKFLRPGGVRTVAAESLLLKHDLLISNRSRHRASNLATLDRALRGLTTLFASPRRITKLGALIKPATLLKFPKALVDRKYRQLFSSSSDRRKPGPKGPSSELIAAIIELKRRNPSFGCARIAQQISHAFGIEIDKASFAACSRSTTDQATPEPMAPRG
jgi:putative transposase